MKKLSKKWKITIGLLGSAALISGVAVATVACSSSANDAQKLANDVGTTQISPAGDSSIVLQKSPSTAQQNQINAAFQAWISDSSNSITLPAGSASDYTLDFSNASITASTSSAGGTITAYVQYTTTSNGSTNTVTSTAQVTLGGFATATTSNQMAYALNNNVDNAPIYLSGLTAIALPSNPSGTSKSSSSSSSTTNLQALLTSHKTAINTAFTNYLSSLPSSFTYPEGSSSKATTSAEYSLDLGAATFVSGGTISVPVYYMAPTATTPSSSNINIEISGFQAYVGSNTTATAVANGLQSAIAAYMTSQSNETSIAIKGFPTIGTNMSSSADTTANTAFQSWLTSVTTGASVVPGIQTALDGYPVTDFTITFTAPTSSSATTVSATIVFTVSKYSGSSSSTISISQAPSSKASSNTTPSKATPSKATPSKATPSKATSPTTTPSKATPSKATPSKATSPTTTPSKTTSPTTTPSKTTSPSGTASSSKTTKSNKGSDGGLALWFAANSL